MKLREEDKQWLTDLVQDSLKEKIDLFSPHGWRRVTFWLQEWGLSAAAVATPLTLLGLLITVGIFAASGMTKNAEFRTHTEDRLTQIEGELTRINDSLRSSELKQLVSSPINPASAKKISVLVDAARAPETRLDEGLVRDAGKKLISVAKDEKNENAWNAALSLISYQSFLNVGAHSIPASTTSSPLVTHYDDVTPPGGRRLVACRRVTITRLLASKLSWPLAAKSYSRSNSGLT